MKNGMLDQYKNKIHFDVNNQTTDQPTTQQYSIMAATGMKNNNIQGALNVQPPHSVFQIDANGSQNKHEIINTTDKRHAFKVKSSNNDFYRVSIVYGFVEPQAKVSLNIHRQPGGKAQPDKFVVQWAEVPAHETDPKAPFVAQAQSGEVVFTVESKEKPAPKES